MNNPNNLGSLQKMEREELINCVRELRLEVIMLRGLLSRINAISRQGGRWL